MNIPIIRPLRNHIFLIVWYDFDFRNSNFRCEQRMYFWGFNNAMLSSIHILEEEESKLCIDLFIHRRHSHILVYMWTSVTHQITYRIPGTHSQNPSQPLIPLSKVKSMHSTCWSNTLILFLKKIVSSSKVQKVVFPTAFDKQVLTLLLRLD